MPPPLRIYEQNIIHNPLKWFGIWTPEGWRVHKKRWGSASRFQRLLSGDGTSICFDKALRDSSEVNWQDDLHLQDDDLTDAGIYPSDPRVEYPPGRPRWAVSHTLLCYPHADHNLYTHEYCWNLETGDLQTHFREHVVLEEAMTDADQGLTVRTKQRPISVTIEGNKTYENLNSSVRGVWSDPGKTSRNFYTRRVVAVMQMANAVYGIVPHAPLVQCNGIWRVLPEDPIDDLFDKDTGICINNRGVIEQMKISLDEPKIGMLRPTTRTAFSHCYEQEMSIPSSTEATFSDRNLLPFQSRLGERFEEGRVGYAATLARNQDSAGYEGYDAQFDLNNDGVIDEKDLEKARKQVGRTVRHNLYLSGYFGGNWVSVGAGLLAPEHYPGIKVVVDYEYGGGYQPKEGLIHLLDTPGPNQRVWIEYHYDVPARAGDKNILVHCYRELPSA